MILKSLDLGITHFDLANNYGPPPCSAESTFGQIFENDLKQYRDEIVISTKAGYWGWNGPYGDGGSKKYLVASLNASLKRMKLDYVDIFYSHRFDPETPLEETMGALDLLVKQGKALYAGISNYSAENTRKAYKILKELGTPCLIHQQQYNMFDRSAECEHGVLFTANDLGLGVIVFCPLAKGLLTSKYLNGIPEASRAASASEALNRNQVTENLDHIMALNNIALNRGQTLAQMALSWCLRRKEITSVLIGASSVSQIENNIGALESPRFSHEELTVIDDILNNNKSII